MNLRRAAALAALLALCACGQRGPLYLPGDPNEGRIVLPDELPGADEQEDEDDDDGDPAERDEQAGER